MTVEECCVRLLNQNVEREVRFLLKDDKAMELTGEICEMLRGKGFTIQQAEILLDLTKVRLRKTEI